MNVRSRRSVAEHLAEYAIIVVLAVAALVTIFPLIYVFNNSISGSTAILGGTVWLWPKNITWSGYVTVVKSTEVWRSYYNRLWYTGVGTAIKRLYHAHGRLPPVAARLPWPRPADVLHRVHHVVQRRHHPDVYHRAQPGAVRNALGNGAADRGGGVEHHHHAHLPAQQHRRLDPGVGYAVAHWNAYSPALIYLPDPDLHPLQMILRKFLILPPEEEERMAFEAIAGVTRNRFVVIMVETLPILAVYPFLQRYFIKGVMIGALKG